MKDVIFFSYHLLLSSVDYVYANAVLDKEGRSMMELFVWIIGFFSSAVNPQWLHCFWIQHFNSMRIQLRIQGVDDKKCCKNSNFFDQKLQITYP